MTALDKARLTVSWLKQVMQWLRRATIVGVAAVPILAGVGYLIWQQWREQPIRFASLALQILGLLSVAYGVSATRQQFEHPTIAARVRTFFQDLPPFPRPVTGVVIALQGVNAASSTGSIGARVLPAPTIEERLRALEEQTAELARTVAIDRDAANERLRLQGERIDAEARHRTDGDETLRQQLETTATGGLDLSLCGVVWLLFGSVFGTVPQEIGQLIRWLFG